MDEYFIKIETVIAFILQFQLDSRSMIDIKTNLTGGGTNSKFLI